MKCTRVVEWAVPCYLFESSRFPEVTLLQDTSIAPSSPPSSPSLLVPTVIFSLTPSVNNLPPNTSTPLATRSSEYSCTFWIIRQKYHPSSTSPNPHCSHHSKICRRHHALTFTHSPFRHQPYDASAPPTTKDRRPLSRWFKLMHLTCSLHVCWWKLTHPASGIVWFVLYSSEYM
jgi:hypothetical protein